MGNNEYDDELDFIINTELDEADMAKINFDEDLDLGEDEEDIFKNLDMSVKH